MVDAGITALIGDVLTGNTLAVVAEAYPINMPMITASATAAEVTYDAETGTVKSNVFRTCFIDPFQGQKMAEYAANELKATSAAVLFDTGNDYSIGVKDAFVATCTELVLKLSTKKATPAETLTSAASSLTYSPKIPMSSLHLSTIRMQGL